MSNIKSKKITRRKFINKTSIAIAGSSLISAFPEFLVSKPKTDDSSDVVLIRDKAVLDENGRPRQEVVLDMLDKAVSRLTGKYDPIKGWKTIIRPDDVVGIKTNVWKFINTTSAVEQALKKRVLDSGVGEKNISISDRGVLRDPVFKKATALINARPMRTHHWAGLGTLLKNYIMFVPQPSLYHGDSCADLGKLWKLPAVKGKTRLNVLVMLTPQFHNIGPHGFNPKYVWKYYGLIVGFDPVSIDYTGMQIIKARRKIYFGEDRPLNPPAKHIELADSRHHIGHSNPGKINLMKMGFKENILI